MIDEIDSRQRPLLILDLDETLICAVTGDQTDQPDFIVGEYFVYCRPYLDEFLRSCAEHFDLAIWSSGSEDYVRAITNRIFPDHIAPLFVWTRDRCTEKMNPETGHTFYQKDLKKVVRRGFSLARTIIVEDIQQNVERNYGNAIYVSPFTGSATDDELRKLAKYLAQLSQNDDFRRLEKRYWQRTTSDSSN